MDFNFLLSLGAASVAGGLLTTIYFFVSRRAVSPPARSPSFPRYFGIALVVAVSGYVAGTAIGIYFACSSPDSGNLCGLYGALGAGPILSGLCLGGYGLSHAHR